MSAPREVLAHNLSAVEARIAAACLRAARPRASVQLIAVSKRHPPAAVELAWQLGQRHFGENYAQELRDKHVALGHLAGLRWHAIGPVQTKNAKYIARAAHAFHALTSLELAQELSKRRTGGPLEVLIEVNLGVEAGKAGIAPHAVPALVAAVRALPGLEVIGLTGMPPLVQDAQDNRVHFKALACLAREVGVGALSMGTTSDFEVAIEEGATFVRVGTAIFGERPDGATAP